MCSRLSSCISIHAGADLFLFAAYGCTELSGPCVQSGVRDTNLPITAAGTLIANMEMKFLEVDGPGESARGPGEITVRGPNVMM